MHDMNDSRVTIPDMTGIEYMSSSGLTILPKNFEARIRYLLR